jgi:hypothetical protein
LTGTFLNDGTKHSGMKKLLLLAALLGPAAAFSQAWTKQYSHVDEFRCGMALVDKNEIHGFVNKDGKLIVPLKYEEALSFNECFAGVKLGGKWGFVDTSGREIVAPRFDEVFSFSEGLAVVSKDGSYGYINGKGELVIPMSFSNAHSFTEGMAAVSNKKGLWGFINKNGREVIGCKYNFANPFTDGVARVMKEDKWINIDKNDKPVKDEQP